MKKSWKKGFFDVDFRRNGLVYVKRYKSKKNNFGNIHAEVSSGIFSPE